MVPVVGIESAAMEYSSRLSYGSRSQALTSTYSHNSELFIILYVEHGHFHVVNILILI